jgi:hypothetical protein
LKAINNRHPLSRIRTAAAAVKIGGHDYITTIVDNQNSMPGVCVYN